MIEIRRGIVACDICQTEIDQCDLYVVSLSGRRRAAVRLLLPEAGNLTERRQVLVPETPPVTFSTGEIDIVGMHVAGPV